MLRNKNIQLETSFTICTFSEIEVAFVKISFHSVRSPNHDFGVPDALKCPLPGCPHSRRAKKEPSEMPIFLGCRVFLVLSVFVSLLLLIIACFGSHETLKQARPEVFIEIRRNHEHDYSECPSDFETRRECIL